MPPRKPRFTLTPELARRILSGVLLVSWLVLQRHTKGQDVGTVPADVVPTPTMADAGTGDAEQKDRGKPLPPKPFKHQQRGPCAGSKVMINGGCWLEAAQKPPCPADLYEWRGACYWPIDERGNAMSHPY
jgi:hypothetical protein